jgi:hypothetical protein
VLSLTIGKQGKKDIAQHMEREASSAAAGASIKIVRSIS